ncbi:hypothetical protein HK102_010842, partial [Quaeritorhiza haematococci]
PRGDGLRVRPGAHQRLAPLRHAGPRPGPARRRRRLDRGDRGDRLADEPGDRGRGRPGRRLRPRRPRVL